MLCTSTRPDFNAEEVASVTKDQRELVIIVEDMADHLPIEDPNKGNLFISSLAIYSLLLALTGLTCNDQDGRKWTLKKQRRKCLVDCSCFCKV